MANIEFRKSMKKKYWEKKLLLKIRIFGTIKNIRLLSNFSKYEFFTHKLFVYADCLDFRTKNVIVMKWHVFATSMSRHRWYVISPEQITLSNEACKPSEQVHVNSQMQSPWNLLRHDTRVSNLIEIAKNLFHQM